MKLKNLLLVSFSLFVYAVNAQTDKERKLPWDYPVKPWTDELVVTDEWKQLKTRQETIDASQIPEKVLSSLSTDDLVELCMKNPLLGEIWHYKPYDNGLDSLIKRINCFRELFKREDASKGLLKFYKYSLKNMSFLESDAASILKGDFVVKIAIVEIFLTRCQSPESTKKENFMEILANLVEGYEKMLMYPDYFWAFSLNKNLFSRARQIVKINKLYLEQIPQKDKNSVLFGGDVDEDTIHVINELSYQIIKQK